MSELHKSCWYASRGRCWFLGDPYYALLYNADANVLWKHILSFLLWSWVLLKCEFCSLTPFDFLPHNPHWYVSAWLAKIMLSPVGSLSKPIIPLWSVYCSWLCMPTGRQLICLFYDLRIRVTSTRNSFWESPFPHCLSLLFYSSWLL